MENNKVRSSKGILNPNEGLRNFQLAQVVPSTELAPFVEYYWTVQWEFQRSAFYVAETLPHPSVHLVFENQTAEIYGVIKTKFCRELKGTGRTIGVKFRPGMFHPFWGVSVSTLTNQRVTLSSMFGVPGEALGNEISREPDQNSCIQMIEQFLKDRLKGEDRLAVQVRDMVERIALSREVIRAEQVCHFSGMGLRKLERMFKTYVGVSPKWVIQRFRLMEAAQTLGFQREATFTEIALALGYYDQSHFIRDFKAMVGVSPSEYAKFAFAQEEKHPAG
ncbi:MAG: hypothetical protein A2600_12190 [Candidatus Lambdaproteobacteria bacterium RIFOXYD1_FULL_56_27]|uniref:HTH araC/xylS-type domain-containing protein n=1 Tax=Candidatus Lambdaproteobacteria bacterium RIFOXYD2_FULL_56_26 TaxID=1817773 RepID=A0A1F6GSY8_9PROT|nr:MAG: hypothetical protein A2426_11955 [Candidatus Lambdaproteobacteria bacterium RIFOXYC1_FULL_56_13]OGH01282.1 MAG: hypothetical protein A2557_11350 [Candidatus Lambdaproteobacteria bacterium RIFOXYD2_FULL_56_26]OGH06259.1 MAG: hypothetical protein A2600_12190 [Candidatus Lambdaproteobacteria bacterium RIFOXYD1_FULL_56_27]